jgi:hypothetical protein
LADKPDREKTASLSPLSYLLHPSCPSSTPSRLLPPAAETPNTFILLFSTHVCLARQFSSTKSPLYQKLFPFCDYDQYLGHVPWKRTPFRNFTQIFTNKHFHIAGPIRIEFLFSWTVAIQLYKFQGAFHAQACPTKYRLPAHFPR